MTCEVLLATFNSAPFLPQLLDSLLAQTMAAFRLVVRDDGSSDATLDILDAYRPRFEGRMRLLDDRMPSGSAKANFARLMAASDAPYVFFADHDDVWEPWKVERTLTLLKQTETIRGSNVPAFVFTDARPTDQALRPLAESYWKFKKIDPRIARKLPSLLVCPPMLGCTSAANRALVKYALPVPVDAVTGHDWWLMLVAAIFGEVAWLDAKSIAYRLHGANVSGQQRVGLVSYAREANWLPRVRRGMMLRHRQAQAIIDQYGPRLPPPARRTIERFVQIEHSNFIEKRTRIILGGYLYPDLARNVAMLVAC